MSQVQGSLVRAYLYQSVWTLTETSGSGEYYLRVGAETSGVITMASSTGANIQTLLLAMTQFSSGDVTVTGDAGGAFTISFLADYAFSGIGVEIADADSTAVVAVARTFQTTLVTKSEANGYYKMGVETSLDVNMEIENQDVTSKDSAGWRETKSQIKQLGLSASNFYTSTENYDKLVGQYELALPVVICYTEPDVTGTEQVQNFGVYNINSINQNATFNQNVEFSADFQLTGSPTRVITGA